MILLFINFTILIYCTTTLLYDYIARQYNRIQTTTIICMFAGGGSVAGGCLKTLTWFGGYSIFLTGQFFYSLVVSAFPHTK